MLRQRYKDTNNRQKTIYILNDINNYKVATKKKEREEKKKNTKKTRNKEHQL